MTKKKLKEHSPWTSGYVHVCKASNTWRDIALFTIGLFLGSLITAMTLIFAKI